MPHHGVFHHPIVLGLQRPVGVGRARIPIVDEHHAVADEDFVFDRDAGTYERVTRDFAATPDFRVALNLDERAKPRVVSNLAAVKIYVDASRTRSPMSTSAATHAIGGSAALIAVQLQAAPSGRPWCSE